MSFNKIFADTKITKAVIPCGGLGTRFLPITKAVPKEILPVIDTPVLGHIVNEAIDSGITDILIVLGKGKEAIKNYFTPNLQLEKHLENTGKKEFADILRKINGSAKIVFREQKEPKGSGDAVLYAEEFSCGEPFALAWGDDLMYSNNEPVIKQLINGFNKCGGTIIGVQTWPGDDIVKYGVAAVGSGQDRLYKCSSIVEKPKLSEIPSRLAALGRYILTPDVFDAIRKTPNGANGELQLTDTLNAMCKNGAVYVYDFDAKRYDMGDKFGSVQAIIEYALRSDSFGEKTRQYILELAKTL